MTTPDVDVTFIVRSCDDEERIGHVLRRAHAYLRQHRLTAEIVVRHALPGHGFFDACQRARGRVIVLADARTEAPLAPLGYALGRLRDGLDVVALGGRYLVMRRTRTWRAFEALRVTRRDPLLVQRRFLRRARQLDLACVVTERKRKPRWRLWHVLRPTARQSA